ncbi:hypothetical protein PLEOSDRAFT_160117 [Pleurotus ostreatus PC15]|uniref:DUF6534 domain-containing protein n=1 Tax=Pleurotus ostreatus (strain PC15) TaxID=1137138 RepID=A0A067NES7_PLEO1|nr:hypothetical protein PLEOSDRAFT_160117 [Pleurotus ostreatus PC15]
METLNTAFDIALIYEPLILCYGTEEAVKFVPLMLIADPIVMAFISTPIQLFFARWIYIISGSMLIMAPILFFAFCSLTGAIAATICTAIICEFARLQELKGAIMMWLFSSAIADIIITTSLLVHLYRKKTGVKATDDMINKIMRFTLQMGLLTSIFASLGVILFIAIPDTAYNFALDFPLSKLYTNSLLSSLNARVEYEKMKVDHLSIGNTTGAEGLEFRQFSSPQTHVPPGTFQRLRRGGATNLQQIPGETQRDPASPGGRSDFKVDLGLDGGSTPA